MKRFFATLLFVFISVGAGAGTSVGNFSFRTQIEFDFRIGFPMDWTYTPGAPTPGEIEKWEISNKAKVKDQAHVSQASLAFLNPFPATSDQELLAEITRRHPGLSWKPIQNPDFTVGFVSDQVFEGPARTKAFEYYFSEKNKVVRIEAVRDKVQEGATELDGVLSTVRRPSGKPRVVSVKAVDPKKEFRVGDTACYKLEVDLLKNDFDRDSLSAFEVKGVPAHWSFKTVKWDRASTSFEVCMKVSARFGADGLEISRLALSPPNGEALECRGAGPKIICDEEKATTVSYEVPRVLNPLPQLEPPSIQAVKSGRTPRSVRLKFQSSLPIAIGVVKIDSKDKDDQALSQIVYPDQFKNGEVEIEFDADRLRPGFTRVLEIMMSDDVGNVATLKAVKGDRTYTLYRTNASPQPTEIAVVSLMGEKR